MKSVNRSKLSKIAKKTPQSILAFTKQRNKCTKLRFKSKKAYFWESHCRWWKAILASNQTICLWQRGPWKWRIFLRRKWHPNKGPWRDFQYIRQLLYTFSGTFYWKSSCTYTFYIRKSRWHDKWNLELLCGPLEHSCHQK